MPKSTKRKPTFTPRKSVQPSASGATPPPAPFIVVPPSLDAFLNDFPKPHIYLANLDTHPRDFKRRLFAVPLMLNLVLICLLYYRLQYAVPTYFSLFLSVLGHKTEHTIDVHDTDMPSLVMIGGERTFMLMGDFLLLRFIGTWPYEFFLNRSGNASPVAWRRLVGFRDTEVVIRRSRRWDGKIFGKDQSGRGDGDVRTFETWLENAQESEEWKERILPAVDKAWIRTKTGSTMLDKSWDLYFQGMIDAHVLVDQGENTLEDFRTTCFAYTETWGWLMWEVWRNHVEESDHEGVTKMQAVKDGLTRMGKENLFFRWIEVVQSETSQPGSFTVEKQRKAAQKIKEEFEEQGVDFDGFWREFGGVETMPGMQITN